jgi:HlyD family secretion protein
MKSIKFTVPGLFVILLACNNSEAPSDAFGNFEAIEIMVSSEAQGLIRAFAPREGDRLEQGAVSVVVDTIQLHLKRLQLQSVLASLGPRINTLNAQVSASRVQLENLEREKQRIDKLVEGGAATSKQQDDMMGQIELLQAQIVATESQKASVHAERKTMEIQIRQVVDQIRKCTVRNPMDGVLLTKYKEAGEIAVPGQPLFKMANLDELILRAYISGNQLSAVMTGGTVMVRFDAPEGIQETSGVVSWVSPQAEFTPKIIQTREERVNMVYAIQVVVPNNGRLKIGMPGEVVF